MGFYALFVTIVTYIGTRLGVYHYHANKWSTIKDDNQHNGHATQDRWDGGYKAKPSCPTGIARRYTTP